MTTTQSYCLARPLGLAFGPIDPWTGALEVSVMLGVDTPMNTAQSDCLEMIRQRLPDPFRSYIASGTEVKI